MPDEYDQGWGDENELWLEPDNFREAILDKVHILDILDKYGIEYTRASAGNFTHKLKCPFPNHLNGQERTASLCVSEKENNFFCFGCNSNGSVIDFTMLFLGVPYYRALEILSGIAGITKIDDLDKDIQPIKKVDPNHTVMPYVFKAGVLIREFLSGIQGLKEYDKWCSWANKQYAKLDYYLDTLEDEQWETAKKYCDRIEKYLRSKEKKYEQRH